MDLSPLVRCLLLALIAVALILPIAICIVLGVGSLLGSMGDAVGGRVLGWIALAGGILWGIDLVALLLVQTFLTLSDRDRHGPQ
jgi:hypothetical protein